MSRECVGLLPSPHSFPLPQSTEEEAFVVCLRSYELVQTGEAAATAATSAASLCAAAACGAPKSAALCEIAPNSNSNPNPPPQPDPQAFPSDSLSPSASATPENTPNPGTSDARRRSGGGARSVGRAADPPADGRLKSASQPAKPVNLGTPTKAQAPQGGKPGPDSGPQAKTSRKRDFAVIPVKLKPQQQRSEEERKEIADLEKQIRAEKNRAEARKRKTQKTG